MESRLGHDFSRVRIHTGLTATQSARSVGALAYAVGPHIVLGGESHARSSPAGLGLLAHELAHTVQHDGGVVGPRLEIGGREDRAEREADRIAARVTGGGTAGALWRSQGPAILRRAPEEPKPLRTDTARLDAPEKGAGAKIRVWRDLISCECRKVPLTQSGAFWNPNLNAFAIVYRHCRGGTTTDVYGEVQSNLTSFLAGGPPPVGTAKVGIEVNVVGRSAGGRVLLEVLGSNTPGSTGVGGRAQIVAEGGRWRAYVTADFLHGLGATAGDRLDIDLGAKVGRVSVEAQISNVLSGSPTGTGAGCIDIGTGSTRPCLIVSGGPGGTSVGVGVRGRFGGPPVRPDDCHDCLCPPPTPRFRCILDIPPSEKPVTREEDVEVAGEHRYYFRLDQTAISRDPVLQARSRAELAGVARDVAAGSQVVSISAYASPEAPEAHNQTLSVKRSKVLSDLVRSSLPSGTKLPEPLAGGELLGRRPAPSAGSRLGEIVARSGIRSAEDLSVLLWGDEIPRRELSDQFVSLFRALPEPADRLAVFGVVADDPLAKPLLGAIDEFLRRPGAGARPWERVFGHLRVGVVRTSRQEKRTVPGTEEVPGKLLELEESDCKTRGALAEERGLLPRIPDELRKPERARDDRETDCLLPVSDADKRGGCSYDIPADWKKPALTAPARAPRPLP